MPTTSRSATRATIDARRLIAHDRRLASTARGVLLRWLSGPHGLYLVNGPVFNLPAELKLQGDVRLLDIGAGRGAVARALGARLPTPAAGVALEPSGAALRLGRTDDAPGEERARFVRGVPHALPLASGSFDLVTCGYVVRHLDDDELRALLLEIYRVLDGGGLAVIWDFGPSGNPRLDRWNARLLRAATGERPRLRSTATLRRHAEEAGFELAVDAALRPFLFPPMPRASVLIGRAPDGWRAGEPFEDRG